MKPTGTEPVSGAMDPEARDSVLTLGETMALLSLPEHGRIGAGTPLSIGIGGAESNVAIAVARLGVGSTWVGRIGDDDFGSMIVRQLLGEGVQVIARRDPRARTGLMVKEHRRGQPSRVRYYRVGSAGSRFSISDLDEQAVAAAGILHVSGITPALGDEPAAAVHRAIDVARSASTLVSFDVNYRSTLWPAERARESLSEIAARADVVFAGFEEAALLLGVNDEQPDEGPWAAARTLAAQLAEITAAQIVLKLGRFGALALQDGTFERMEAFPTEVVDPVGAGDAFVGGYLASLARGRDTRECLETGARLGALVCSVPGDWEGLLDWEGGATFCGAEDVVR